MNTCTGKVAVVVPTIRPEMMNWFLREWHDLFVHHNVELIVVVDKKEPWIEHGGRRLFYIPKQFRTHLTAACRNYGFAYVWNMLPSVEYIITLDDDESPIGDPIQDHIDALDMRVPISWLATTIVRKSTDYMRGFPYGVRTEAPVMLSHGVWRGVPDRDAPTQLHDTGEVEFYRGPIPKGVLFPMCGMNLAFRREALPYVFFALVGSYKGAERFDDIWGGVELKRDFDRLGWGVVTGYATVQHDRASNVFRNLEREAVGMRKHEEYWKGDTDAWYDGFIKKRKAWRTWLLQ